MSVSNPARRTLALALLTSLATTAHASSEAEAAADPVQLAPVVVSAERDDSYLESDTKSATKTDTPVIDTQQSISVINRERMEAQGVLTVQDALRYSAGVRSDAYGIDSRGDGGFVRGTNFEPYLDGLRQFQGFFSPGRTDAYTLDRIEIVRGPASVLFGQGTTGGLVSLVSKTPLSTARHEVEVQLGSDARKQIAFDSSAPLSKDGVWSYRLIGNLREANSQVHFAPDDHRLLQPSLRWQPSENTRWTLIGNLQADDGGSTLAFLPHQGTLLPNPNGQISTRRFVSEPGFDAYNSEQQSVTSLFEHRFNAVWSVAQNTRWHTSEVDYRSLYTDVFSNPANPFLDAAQRTVARFAYAQLQDRNYLATDSRVEARFNFAGLKHRVLAGLDYATTESEADSNFAFVAEPFDLFSPVYGTPTGLGVLAPEPGTETAQTGVYLQDQIEYGTHWLGTLGVRRDTAKTQSEGSDEISNSATSSRAGLMYRFANGVQPYASYSESFQPFDFVDFFGNPFKPTRGKQTEVGVKVQPAGSQALITATLFDLRETNRLSSDPANPFNSLQLGSTKSRGAELEATAQLARRLDLFGSYTYTDIGVSDGSLVAGVPLHQASAWGRYEFGIAGIPGFNIGAGARYIGETTDETGALVTPDLTLIDLGLGYEQGPVTVAVNAANLEDQSYVATCLSRGDCFYGPRRSVVARVAYRW